MPNARDGVVTLDVNRGNITVGSGGVNTDGLSTFDLVAKMIRIDGAVGDGTGATTDIKAVAGSGSFDTSTRDLSSAVRRVRRAADAHTGYAIDGSAAGAMHGRAISLISTDAGLGVRQPGMLVSPGDIMINARGNIEVGSAKARQLDLHSRADVKAAMVQTAGKLSAIAGGNLAVDALVTGNGARLTAESGDLRMGPDGNREVDSSELTGELDISARQGSVILSRGFKTDALKVRAKNWVLRNAVAEVTGKDGVANSVDIDVSGRIVLAGSLHGADDAGAVLTDSLVKVIEGRPVVQKASTGETLHGYVVGSNVGIRALKGDVLLKGGTLENQNSVIAALAGKMTVDLTADMENQGLVRGKKGLSVSAQNIKNTFELSSQGKVDVSAREKLENQGEISSLVGAGVVPGAGEQQLTLRAGSAFSNSGFVASTGKILIEGVAGQDGAAARPAMVNTRAGRIDGAELTIAGASFDSEGVATARNGMARVDVDGAFRSTGQFMALGKNGGDHSLDLRAGSMHVDGILKSARGMKLAVTDDTEFASGANVEAKNMTLTTRDLSNAGVLRVSGEATVEASQDIINRGKLQARKLDLSAQRDIRNLGSQAVMRSMTSLSAQAGRDMVNEGRMRGKTLTLKAASIENRAGAKIDGDQSGSLTATGKIANQGKITIKQADIQARRLENQAGGQLHATEAKVKTTQALLNAGEIKISGMLTASAAKIQNLAGGQLLADTASLTASGAARTLARSRSRAS